MVEIKRYRNKFGVVMEVKNNCGTLEARFNNNDGCVRLFHWVRSNPVEWYPELEWKEIKEAS